MPKRTQLQKQCLGDLTAIAREIRMGRAWIGVLVESKAHAKLLLRQWEEVFQQWASLYGVEEFRLTLPDGSHLGVPSALSGGGLATIRPEAIQSLYTAPGMPINQPVLTVMQRFVECDRPMALLCNDSDNQVWVNEPAAILIQSSGEEAVRRCMRDYWAGEDLEALHTKLRDGSLPFRHSYRAILNDTQADTWFAATSRYEPVWLNGKSYRLSINQDFQIIGKAGLVTAR